MARPRRRSVERVRQTDPNTHSLQDAVEDTVRDIPQIWWTEAKVFDVTFSGTTPVNLTHTLSAPHKGFAVVGMKSAASRAIYEDSAGPGTKLADTHIRLVATGSCTTKIMVWR